MFKHRQSSARSIGWLLFSLAIALFAFPSISSATDGGGHGRKHHHGKTSPAPSGPSSGSIAVAAPVAVAAPIVAAQGGSATANPSAISAAVSSPTVTSSFVSNPALTANLTSTFNFSAPPGYGSGSGSGSGSATGSGSGSPIVSVNTEVPKQVGALGFQAANSQINCAQNFGGGGGNSHGTFVLSLNWSVEYCKGLLLSQAAAAANKPNLAEEIFCGIEEVANMNSTDCDAAKDRIAKNKARKEQGLDGSASPKTTF